MSAADWEEIHHFARTQALLAITFDGMASLPPEIRPPRPLYLQWATLIVRIEQANRQLNSALPELFHSYREAGLHPVLLKGQANAAHYLNPLHRQCGDIDIYIGKEGQATANRLLLHQGAQPEGEASDKHTSYSLHGIHIENHRILLRMNSPAADRYFQSLVKEWYPQQAETKEIDGCPVFLPPPTFNALYIFMHAFLHFLNSGIGLRQVCDWARLLATEQDDIDKTLLEQHFKKYDTRISPRPKGYWTGKWHTFRKATKRCIKLRHFAPGEAVWYPVTLIKRTIAIRFNRTLSTFKYPHKKTNPKHSSPYNN